MRKMKKMTKLVVVMLVAVMALTALSGLSKVSAVTITGTNKLQITRTVNDIARNVDATFTYAVTQKSGPETIDVSGVVPTVAFNPAVTPTNTVAEKTNATALDFSSLNFTKLGTYVFEVTETSDTDPEIPTDTNNKYYVVVEVRNSNPADPDGTLVATLAPQVYPSWDATNGVSGTKTDMAFESDADKVDVTITKNVTGDMADVNEYFPFTITVNGEASAEYTLSGTNYILGADKDNPAADQTKFTGTTATVWMKDNGSVTVGNVPEGTTYTVAETATNGYTTTVDGNDGTSTPTAKTIVSETTDNTAFINHKEQTTLTGVFMNIAPFVGLVVLAVVGIVLIRKTSNND